MATSFKKNLVTAHEYSLKVKPPHSVVSVKNLSTQAYVGGSRWGVSEDALRNQLQPLFISSRLSFAKPFTSAAVADVVDDTTVNYSTLSKAILKAVEVRGDDASGLVGRPKFGLDWTLYDLLDWIDIYLTGRSLSGALVQDLRGRLVERGVLAPKPLLKVDGFEELGFTVFLPKATLLSEGVSLTTSNEPWRSDSYCSVLEIHNIRIPTLIGVNANERLAKQMLVISVEIDPYVCRRHDCYNELEQIVVKVCYHHH
jgi:dihydroneopterin aldolase